MLQRFRLSILLVFAGAAAAFAGDVEAETIRTTGPNHWNWHAGPFFECRRSKSGDASFWALRPFYSQAVSSSSASRDILWPVGTFHYQNSRTWWRVLAAYGMYGDEGVERISDSSFNIFPLWFSGVTRNEETYWGAFPFWGEHPHFLLMDNLRFALWPIWMDYDVKGVHHGAVLWPLFTWKEDNRRTAGLWPIYSHARLRESDHHYLLWPFVTWASYDADRDTSGAGYSWMVWPLCGHVYRERERQYAFLPPFFSYAETPGRSRWRLPWPLVDIENGRPRSRVSVFPLVERVKAYSYSDNMQEEDTWRFLWVIAEKLHLTSKVTEETRYSFWPFWTWERRTTKPVKPKFKTDETPKPAQTSSFLRFWPFYRSSTEKGLTTRRVLDLIPIRHNEGIERNWAPFWTFWESFDRPDGHTRHTLLWNLLRWKTQP